jgi:hypothetical protein
LWRTRRYDIKGAAIDSAWPLATRRRTKDNPTAVEDIARQIGSSPRLVGKARRKAYAVRGHFLAQPLSVSALFMLVVGAVLLAVGWLWN